MDNLQKILADISSWYWWVSVVGVGLIINLASAYLKVPLDRWLSTISTRAARRRELNEQAFRFQVDLMVDSPAYLMSTGFMELRHRLMFVVFVCVSVLSVRGATNPSRVLLQLGDLTIWVQMVLLLAGVVSAVLALLLHGLAAEEARQIYAARRVLRSAREKGAN